MHKIVRWVIAPHQTRCSRAKLFVSPLNQLHSAIPKDHTKHNSYPPPDNWVLYVFFSDINKAEALCPRLRVAPGFVS
ncbi:hypothetical protein VTH06DRAFT_3252 [Thermothelomyces fergusii]